MHAGKISGKNELLYIGKQPLGTRIYKYLFSNKMLWLFVLPGLIYFIVFKYIPMYGIIIAFKDYRGVGGFSEFINCNSVGFLHFKNFFSSIYFGRLLRNTLYLSSLRLLLAFPAPIVLALLINEVSSKRLQRTVQTITP